MDDRTGSSESQSPQLVTFDAILPPAMALRAEETGVKRVATDPLTRFILSVLAGAFIAGLLVRLSAKESDARMTMMTP